MAQALPNTPPLRVMLNPTAAGDNERDLTHIRILGYLIHYIVSDQGLATVMKEIVSASDDQALLAIGKLYFEHYIRAFRCTKGPTPTPSNHASRPSFDTIADVINDTLDEAPRDHRSAKKLALIRDGYRCVVTGRYDMGMVKKVRELQTLVAASGLRTVRTEVAHIFDESTNQNIEPGSNKREYAATMWVVMRRFGYESLPDTLNGNLVHRLENVMSLRIEFHAEFDRLNVWFVETEEENKYKLEGTDPYWLSGYPEYVTFTTPDQSIYPVPSPVYLAIHAACAKVAHLSGAAACIDEFESDMEDGQTLNPDGGSASMLEQAIFALRARGHEVTV